MWWRRSLVRCAVRCAVCDGAILLWGASTALAVRQLAAKVAVGGGSEIVLEFALCAESAAEAYARAELTHVVATGLYAGELGIESVVRALVAKLLALRAGWRRWQRRLCCASVARLCTLLSCLRMASRASLNAFLNCFSRKLLSVSMSCSTSDTNCGFCGRVSFQSLRTSDIGHVCRTRRLLIAVERVADSVKHRYPSRSANTATCRVFAPCSIQLGH